MKHTECEDCELREGDCGYHFKMDGVTNYDIASLSACDKYGNCEFFKQKVKLQGDLISREALKKELNSRVFQDDYATTLLLSSFNDIIDNAPTVDERPQGEWLFDKENSFTIDMFKCSICGCFGATHFKFCPNCGADMRKGGTV